MMTEKEKFIKEFNEAFVKGDIPLILDCMAENIEWEMVGGSILSGKDGIEKELAAMEHVKTMEMKVDKVITHGKLASSNGWFKIRKKEKEKAYGFCDFYEFTGFKNAKIRKMTSYVVPLKKDED